MRKIEINFFELIFPDVIKDNNYGPILVGSRATGHHTNHSDWDYLVMENHKETILIYLENNNILYTTNRNGSIKFVVEVTGITRYTLNLCFAPNVETYDVWKKATDVMTCAPRDINKSQRINMFVSLVKHFCGDAYVYANGES